MNVNIKNFEDVKSVYNSLPAWGILSSLDIRNCDIKKITDKSYVEQFAVELCDLIGMKRFGDPVVVHFGEDEHVEGFSLTQLIETSLVSGHFANSSKNVYIDIFSCKVYDPFVAAKFTTEFFGGDDYDINVLFRK
ncbi:S-adenosylmethionine decarboxylase [Sulfurimonas sp.]|nr:S-adenosylmethionine decarboxylase [Sulfurimonas sp.]